MKNSIILSIIITAFCLTSCGGSSSKNSKTEEAVITKKVQVLDSLSNDLENLSEEIEENAVELEAALKELEKEFEN